MKLSSWSRPRSSVLCVLDSLALLSNAQSAKLYTALLKSALAHSNALSARTKISKSYNLPYLRNT